MFELDDAWVWDHWTVDDGQQFHMFFLFAPRGLPSPDDRHFHARIGHAVSDDLRRWERLADPLADAARPAFDDLATWTGSVTRGQDGLWYMFYTGASRAEQGLVQRVGSAVSDDLVSWQRTPLVLEADRRWYEKLDTQIWPDEAWRDPWVFPDEDGTGWHMLVTARSAEGPRDRGVIGHARSADLLHWEVEPPLSAPGQGFGQLEVPQVEMVDGDWVLIFSCLGSEMRSRRRGDGGVWLAKGDSALGPWDIAGARRLTDESIYAGRIVRDRDGEWWLMGFENKDVSGRFVGRIPGPLRLEGCHASAAQ